MMLRLWMPFLWFVAVIANIIEIRTNRSSNTWQKIS